MAADLAITRRKVTRVTLRQLENVGTFEALAATALVLREAQEADHAALAFDCARSFWRLLLIGSSTPFVEYLPELTQLAASALLDRVQYRGEQVAIGTAPIRGYEHVLRCYCLAREDEGQLEPDWTSWVRERLLLIRGTKGFDLLYALQLPTVATPELQGDPTRYRTFLREQIMRIKAFDYFTDRRWAKRSFLDDKSAFWRDPKGQWPALDGP